MKTKMIVVVVLAAMCVLPLSAQVKVGVEGGMNLSHYLVSGSDGYKAEQVGGMKPGFQLGVTVDYEIGKHWMLMSGLSWLQNRSTMDDVRCTIRITLDNKPPQAKAIPIVHRKSSNSKSSYWCCSLNKSFTVFTGLNVVRGTSTNTVFQSLMAPFHKPGSSSAFRSLPFLDL